MSPPFDLLEAYWDGELLPEQEQRLLAWLGGDRDHLRQFVREAHLHRELRNAALLSEAYGEPQTSPDTLLSAEPSIESAAEKWRVFRFWLASAFRGRRLWASAISALALLSGVLWIWLFAANARVYLVASGLGVSLERGGSQSPIQGRVLLQPGDIVRTQESTQALIEYAKEKTQLNLYGASMVQVAQTNRIKRIELLEGVLYGTIARQRFGRALTFVTPQAEARILGTALKLSVHSGLTELEVYSGTVRLARLSNAEWIKVAGGNYAVVGDGIELGSKPIRSKTGSILWEYWKDIKGRRVRDLVSDPQFPAHPNQREDKVLFESRSSRADSYGVRMRGYLHPPRTGAYTFWIAADDEGELWLSHHERPDGKQRLCYTVEFTALQEWDKHREQKSSPVALVAGRIYFIEALLKQSAGGDGVAVAWEGPGLPRQIISGEYLSPFRD